ncbi:MAG: hypothetical protein ABEI06_03125 [Halobacteriaceae archaeon]
MNREELESASQSLRQAAELVSNEEIEKRIYTQSRELAELAMADQEPEQDRLASQIRTLNEILRGVTDPDVISQVEQARNAIETYQEGGSRE